MRVSAWTPITQLVRLHMHSGGYQPVSPTAQAESAGEAFFLGKNMNKPLSLEDRFWPKVEKTDGCWIWTAFRDKHGYGQIGTGSKSSHAYAHRVSYEIEYGAIPYGKHVLHQCDNPSCVRPDHLFIGTHADNMADMTNKGRGKQIAAGRKGEENGNHRLTSDQVIEIKTGLRNGLSGRGLARKYGVSKTLIYYIRQGKTWAHIKEEK